MQPALDDALRRDLEGDDLRHRRRRCPALDGSTRQRVVVDGHPAVSFCSNDYLALAAHPAVVEAAVASLRAHGLGAGASRLVAGDLPEHRSLESSLADFFDRPAALTFPSGYHANLAAITSLAGPSDLIASDRLNHASLVDACRLSRARVVIYDHADPVQADRALASPGAFRRRLLVSETLFSMDGTVPPLDQLARVAAERDAIFVLDEAHAIGVLGPGGRGAALAAGVVPDVLVGTLGKALASAGGFVVGSRALRDHLVGHARSFLFTTAQPPALAAAAEAALRIVASAEGESLRARLRQHQHVLHAHATSPIVPVLLGTEPAALAASHHLLRQGFFVQAIRPPTVPEGTSRLRVTLSAAHEPDDVAALAAALRDLPATTA